MKLTFLGTGTSQGIPVVGCTCRVCASDDEKDKRLRSSVLIEKDDFSLLIDISPDFRQQMLRERLDRVDAICISHEHNDHVNGLDDIRPINFKWRKDVPVFTIQRVADELRSRFHYVFTENYAARPRLDLTEVVPGQEIEIGPFHVRFIEVMHGDLPILGFILDRKLAYLTDVKYISEDYYPWLRACDTIIMSALHKVSHYTHQNLEEALALAELLDVKHTYFTHIAHHMGLHQVESAQLPMGRYFSFDGLQLDISEHC